MSAKAPSRISADQKIIRISKKRQITIPLRFYEQLGFGTDLICSVEEGRLVLEPLYRKDEAFSLAILRDLVAQGYSGEALIAQFEVESSRMKHAVASMLKEADQIAAGKEPAVGCEDVSGSEE